MSAQQQILSCRSRATPWLAGSIALALGFWVYLVDRPASNAGFGAVGGWLPSFAHALAFSLFTAALLPATLRWEIGACSFWFAVNAAFEVGQHPQLRGPLADALRDGFGDGRVARAVANYFLRGTFDLADLVAAALGAAAAALLLHALRAPKELP